MNQRIIISLLMVLTFPTLAWSNYQSALDDTYKEALIYYKNHNYQETIVILSKAVEHDPNNSVYHTLLGHAYQANQNADMAAHHFKLGTDINSAADMAFMDRAFEFTGYMEQVVPLKEAVRTLRFPAASYAVLISTYMARAIDKEAGGEIDVSLELLRESKELLDRFRVILETPLRLTADELVIVPQLRNGISSRIQSIGELEQEWKAKM